MGNTTQDYMSAFIAIGLVILSFMIIKEIRKSWWKSTVFIGIGIFALWLGLNKVHRDNIEKEKNEKEKKVSDSTIISLSQNVNALSSGRKIDSIKFTEFTINLEKEFHIIRDSVTNKPRTENYTTYFERARDVQIGPSH